MAASPSRKRRNKRGSAVAYLSMVSLMDMFTIILIFLLHTFSAEGEVFSSSATFKLPQSTSEEPYRARLGIQITRQDIIVDGRKVASISELAPGELMIKPLYDELTEQAKKSLLIAGFNPELELNREVVIQGDKTIPFALLQKVMFTCGQVGYNNISLAVISVGKE